MSDPATLRQPGLDARVLVKIGLAIIACLAAVLGVAVAAIFGQIGNARVEVGSVWTGLSAINDRLGRIEKTVDETRTTLDQLARNEQRNEQRTVSVAPNVVAGFYVTAQEAEFIREFLKIPPRTRSRPRQQRWPCGHECLLRPQSRYPMVLWASSKSSRGYVMPLMQIMPSP
jgi:hypothetical protein